MRRQATPDPSAVWLPREPAVVGRLVATGAASGAAVEGAAVALAVAVYGMTSSTAWVSGVLLASLGLSALLSPLGGVVADRYPRRRVMLLSAACQVPIYVLVAVAGEPWQLVVLAGIAAATQRPFDASLAASIPALVPEERRVTATSSVAAAQQTATLLSPAAAGAAMAVAGQRWTFLAIAVLYAGVVATVAGLPGRPAAGHAGQSVRSSLREGLQRLGGDRVLVAITSATAVLVVFSSMTLVAGVALSEGEFGAGETGYGLMVSAWGGGMIVGSLAAGRLAGARPPLRLFAVGLCTAGFALGVISVAPTLIVAIGCLAVGGIGNGLMYTTDQLLFQQRVPHELLGRVVGSAWSVLRTAQAVSFMLGGVVVGLAGVRGVFALAGAGTLVAVLPVLALLVSRREPARAGPPGPPG